MQEFFPEEKKGEFICIVINDAFMKRVEAHMGKCKGYIFRHIKQECEKIQYKTISRLSLEEILPIISVQLYAASIRENTEDFTERAYNPKLQDLLDEKKLFDVYTWMKNFQDDVWKRFYECCEDKGFEIIKKCSPRKGKGRYVQYPLTLARFTFNKEDLLNFPTVFLNYKLSPHDIIAYEDFWREGIFSVDNFRNTSHAQGVIDSIREELKDDYLIKRQIYNFFNSWEGQFKEKEETSVTKSEPSAYERSELNQISLSLEDEDARIYVCHDGYEEASFDIDLSFPQKIEKKYHFRRGRKNLILFQQDDSYDDYWSEVLFVNDKREEGLVIVWDDDLDPSFSGLEPFKILGKIRFYKIQYSIATKHFYSTSKSVYKLEGGLKIKNHTYLKGGAPLLSIFEPSKYWLDGILYEVKEEVKGKRLDLEVGHHWLKFPLNKKIDIDIEDPELKENSFTTSLKCWNIDRKKAFWKPEENVEGVQGLDFSKYSILKNNSPVLKDWVLALNGVKVKQNKNISIKLLKEQ